MLPKKAADELKELCRKHRGEELTDDQASAIANRFLRMYFLIRRRERDKLNAPAFSPGGDPIDHHDLPGGSNEFPSRATPDRNAN
jgi:hypothetical protein